MPQVIGASFPIPRWFTDRFFIQGKTVFIKPVTIFKELEVGQTFFFYQSREDVGYVGEARIKSITMRDNPLEFFEIFGNKIFLSKSEVEDYIERNKKWKSPKNKPIKQRKKRPWMAIELEKIKKYPKVKKIQGFIPVSGMYIRE